MTIEVHPIPARGMSSPLLPAPFAALRLETTSAWGSRPGEARVTYLLAHGAPPVPVLASVRIVWPNHTWTGVCMDDQQERSDSAGTVRTLRVLDTRQHLEWDTVFAAFNQREDAMVDGRLQRRFWHVLPADFVAGRKTYTRRAYTAREVAEIVFGFTRSSGSPHYTVENRWRLVTPRIMNREPVLDLDWQRGATLQQITQELADKLGLVVGVLPEQPWTLRWERKGYGQLPFYAETASVFPPTSNNRRYGVSYSGAPTRVRVVGDRNVYQIRNMEMVPDWLPAWERMLDVAILEDDLFRRATRPDGVPLNAIPGDHLQSEGRFLAAAMAREISVSQYAGLRMSRPLPSDVSGQEWLDRGLWKGRLRSDMPAALYVGQILFRAFRPRESQFRLAGGRVATFQSMEVLPRMLLPVSHDPNTGYMQVDYDAPADGHGYAIAQGYQIGADGLVTVRPEFFRLGTWRALQDLWQAVPFNIDRTGDGVPVVLFQEPVIRTDNLVDMIDGLPVIRADATIHAPRVRACLTFAADIFQHVVGFSPRDRVELVANLNAEMIADGSGYDRLRELPYADGELARAKAHRIARAILDQPAFTIRGGYTVPGTPGNRIGSLVDRVTVSVGAQGSTETVDFTNERLPVAYESERRFDRLRRQDMLLPGQAELRQEARSLRQLAAATRGSADTALALQSWLTGGADTPPTPIAGAPSDVAMPAGTPLWGMHSTPEDPQRPVWQPQAHYTTFHGVTTRHGDRADGLIPARRTGEIHALVRGPVEPNQTVGRASGDEMGRWLVAGGDVAVGLARSHVPAGVVRLIPVLVSGWDRNHVKAWVKLRIREDGGLEPLLPGIGNGGPDFSVKHVPIAIHPVPIDQQGNPMPDLGGDPTLVSHYYWIQIDPDGPLRGSVPKVTFSVRNGEGGDGAVLEPLTIVRKDPSAEGSSLPHFWIAYVVDPVMRQAKNADREFVLIENRIRRAVAEVTGEQVDLLEPPEERPVPTLLSDWILVEMV